MKLKSRLPFQCGLAAAAIALTASTGLADSILRSAGNFALLGGTGITSTGTDGTTITNGYVGLSPAATSNITGFPPAVVTNGAIVATGAATAQARLDLIKAQVGLASMPSNDNMSTVDLGGKTLEPGVYTFNSEANLNGNLVLDGKGRNNAYWVFQIGTALTTSINSTVTIINPGSNGGKDYGIFWNCGSAINIGGNNQIAGIYLSGTSIVFGEGSTRGGRALALAAITLDDNQINAKGGPGGSDWSGGLMFDRTGRVVSIEKLSFDYSGRKNRVTDRAREVVKGGASANATTIQWRSNNRKWRTVRISNNDKWRARIGNLRMGGNRIRLRARDADGNKTAVQRLTIRRVAQLSSTSPRSRN